MQNIFKIFFANHFFFWKNRMEKSFNIYVCCSTSTPTENRCTCWEICLKGLDVSQNIYTYIADKVHRKVFSRLLFIKEKEDLRSKDLSRLPRNRSQCFTIKIKWEYLYFFWNSIQTAPTPFSLFGKAIYISISYCLLKKI